MVTNYPRVMLRLQRGVGLVALVFLLAAPTACSGGNGNLASSNPKAALAAAYGHTAAANSVKLSFSASFVGGGMSVAKGDGAYDFKNDRGRFKLSVVLGSSIEMVITADKLYLRQPATQPGDKPWVAVTQDDLAEAGSGAGFLGQLRGQVDPRAALRNLGTSVKDVKKAGTAKIRGADTTHLTGTVDLSDAAIAEAPEDQRASMRQARDAIGSDGYPIGVWLDDDGRVRRLEYEMSVATGVGGPATTTVRLDLFAFGDDAGVVIPDAADVKEGLD